MSFARARLIKVADNGSGSSKRQLGKAESVSQEGFTVRFNPTSLKVTYSNTIEGGGSRGKTQSQYVGKQSTEMSVDLLFDTTDLSAKTASQADWGDDEAKQQAASGGGDVDVRVFTLRVAQLMEKREPEKDKSAPWRVQFVWGSFLFEGVVKSLTETLELFSAEGIPLRATLALSISEDKLEFRRAQAASGSVAPLTTPPAGSTAADAASAAGLDPQAGKALAAKNGLDDMRSLPSGVALALPTAGASFSASASASAGFGASASAGFGASASAGFGASASAGFGASASASASASVGASASLTGGFGGGAGVGVTLGGGGGFGLELGAGASASLGAGVGFSASAGVGVSAGVGISAGVGVSASAGFSAGAGFSASAGAGLSAGVGLSASAGVSGGIALGAGGGLIVSGGVAGTSGAAVSLPGAGSVGAPSSGGAPGAQSVMRPDGRISLAPAPPPAALSPPQATRSLTAPTTRASPALMPQRPVVSSPASDLATTAHAKTVVASTVGLPAVHLATAMGLPVLPPSAAPTRGAFQGISGVPMKRVRFGASAPAVRPLAYPRLRADDSCLAAEEPCSTSRASASRSCRCLPRKKGKRCDCRH